MSWIIFGIGLFVGACVGILAAGLCVIAREEG
jgi:uncharacterized membrane-anchored protein YhcB (DUF1043 family)